MRAEGHPLVPVLLLAGDTHGPVVGARRQDDAAGTQRPASLDVDYDQSVLARRMQTGSLIIPLKALVINLFSLAAALGATTWLFEGGHLGLPQTPGLETAERQARRRPE